MYQYEFIFPFSGTAYLKLVRQLPDARKKVFQAEVSSIKNHQKHASDNSWINNPLVVNVESLKPEFEGYILEQSGIGIFDNDQTMY